MITDHYATLGIAPTSHDAVIRSAYVALMRRYHPDRNPSAAAAARVRAITAAYAVLSVPDQRAYYDWERGLALSGAASAIAPAPRELRLSPWLVASFLGAAAVLMLLPLLIPSPLIPPGSSDEALGVEDRYAAVWQERIESATRTELERFCSSQAAFDLIRHELFRRAAQLRGSSGAAFFRVVADSVVRFESPVLTGQNQESGTISCKASVVVDLPQGVVVPGARPTLAANITYSLRTAPGVADMVSLSDEGPLVTPLAGVAQMPRQVLHQLDVPHAPKNRARNERAKVVEQMSSAAQPPAAAVARSQASQPKSEPPQPGVPARTAELAAGADQTPVSQQPKPAWQLPLKPAWQRPLPPPSATTSR